MVRLLAKREGYGIKVRLLWDDAASTEDEIVVEYEDAAEGIAYTLHPPRDRALDAFYHPNAYLNACWRPA